MSCLEVWLCMLHEGPYITTFALSIFTFKQLLNHNSVSIAPLCHPVDIIVMIGYLI